MKDIHVIIIFLVVISTLISIFLLMIFGPFGLWIHPLPSDAHCTQIIHDPLDGSQGNYYACLDFECEHDFCARRYIEPGSTECTCSYMTDWAYNALVAEYGDWMTHDSFACDYGLLGCIAYFCQDECPVENYQRCVSGSGNERKRQSCEYDGVCKYWEWISDCPAGTECVQQGNYVACQAWECNPNYPDTPFDNRYCPSVGGSFCPNIPNGYVHVIYQGTTMNVNDAINCYSKDCTKNRYISILYMDANDNVYVWYPDGTGNLNQLENGKCYTFHVSSGSFCHWEFWEGWLDEYKCSGSYRQRKYKFTDCSTEWLTIEDCSSQNKYCDSGTASCQDCPDCDREYCSYPEVAWKNPVCQSSGACVRQATDCGAQGMVCEESGGIANCVAYIEAELTVTWIDIILQALGLK